MPRRLPLFDELLIDNFAGGGGASTGIELATGRAVDMAINHDPSAIAMHRANHPNTCHYCENVWEVNPRKVTGGRPVALSWFSPDCKHFSKAKGGKPVDKDIRGLAWVAVRWASAVHPRVIILENVEEFKTWGPVKDGKPIKARVGCTFNSFVNALSRLGYTIDWRELRACDYGAPTIRKRFFLVARCDGQPVIWPTPTHGSPDSKDVKSGKLKPWRTAAEIIDWSLPCPSIFDTADGIWQKYGIRAVRPLAAATQRRIAQGIQKFVIGNPEPFIIQIGQQKFGGDGRQYQIDKPITTVVSKAEHCLVVPVLAGVGGRAGQSRPRTADEPLATITAKADVALIAPMLIQYHGEKSKNEVRGQSLKSPLMTAAAANRYGLVSAFMIKYYGQGYGQPVTEPLHTVTSRERFGLVTVLGGQYAITDIGLRMLTPRELFTAQGFPQDYIIDIGAKGEIIPKSAQVARCGNAVPPPFAEALVRANLPELCGRHITSMAELKKEMAA